MTRQATNTQRRQQLADLFRRRIISGQFQPGQRLREVPLAEELGVSRGPIRDTFLQLTKEGLLEAQPNVGVRVARAPSAFKRRTLVQLRRTIESAALEYGFDAGIEPLVDTLRQNLDAYQEACRSEAMDDVVMLDMAFHRSIVAAADGGSMLPTWLPVISQMLLRYSRHRSLTESYDEHAAVVEAMASRDRQAAAAALCSHIL
jgi:DNA-binding GntR family transcriptional regulator